MFNKEVLNSLLAILSITLIISVYLAILHGIEVRFFDAKSEI